MQKKILNWNVLLSHWEARYRGMKSPAREHFGEVSCENALSIMRSQEKSGRLVWTKAGKFLGYRLHSASACTCWLEGRQFGLARQTGLAQSRAVTREPPELLVGKLNRLNFDGETHQFVSSHRLRLQVKKHAFPPVECRSRLRESEIALALEGFRKVSFMKKTSREGKFFSSLSFIN